MQVDNKKTHTTLFLVQSLEINKVYLDKFGFVNAYLSDVNHETKYENSLYLVFKPEDLSLFEKFVQSEKKRMKNLFLEDYDSGYGYVILVYKFPDKYQNELKLFFEGKYSKFSREYKSLFPEVITVKDEYGYDATNHSLYFHIFEKTQAMKNYLEEKYNVELDADMEYYSIPNMDRETFNIEKFIKQEKVGEYEQDSNN
jgi:hypothetical protein